MTSQYSLVPQSGGINYLGGEIPSNFNIPENSCPGSFQYLGMLSNDDQAFSWLPFDLNLICPVYMNIDKVWLDYTDPQNPVIINVDEVNNLDSEYDDLKPGSVITYEKVKFNTQIAGAPLLGRIGLAGLPSWLQNEDIPVCPKTTSKMKFLCQLEYRFDTEIKVQYTNVVNEDDWYKTYFETMNFWGDGDLYIFFEAKSKIACYFIQKT